MMRDIFGMIKRVFHMVHVDRWAKVSYSKTMHMVVVGWIALRMIRGLIGAKVRI